MPGKNNPLRKLKQTAFQGWFSFLRSMPTSSENLNLISKFKTSEIFTTRGDTTHDGLWGVKTQSMTQRNCSCTFWSTVLALVLKHAQHLRRALKKDF